MDQLFDGIDVGDREMLNVKNIVWLNDQSFYIESYVSYLGYSGHPGIDSNLKNKLGDKFANTDDIVTLPTRKYTIKWLPYAGKDPVEYRWVKSLVISKNMTLLNDALLSS